MNERIAEIEKRWERWWHDDSPPLNDIRYLVSELRRLQGENKLLMRRLSEEEIVAADRLNKNLRLSRIAEAAREVLSEYTLGNSLVVPLAHLEHTLRNVLSEKEEG